ncbi:MAG: PhzF family phenazine biosynthesis protein, partial [Ruminiclostridium sp.]|nr:PhzF family phenazine biosynthesis protein [Ruminiclostridium sp.]
MEIYRASAFSKDGAGGNKAGVVLDQTPLTPAQKQEIAKEVGYSETVFFSESREADYRLEYFTPTDEVP